MKSRRRSIRHLRTVVVLSLCVPLSASAGALAATTGDTKADHPAPQSSPKIVGDTPADYDMPGAAAAPVPKIVGDTPADYDMPGAAAAPAPKIVGDTPADYDRPDAPAQSEPTGATATRAHVPGASGFDWPSAAIGAAGVGLLIVLSLGGFSVLSHHRTRLAR